MDEKKKTRSAKEKNRFGKHQNALGRKFALAGITKPYATATYLLAAFIENGGRISEPQTYKLKLHKKGEFSSVWRKRLIDLGYILHEDLNALKPDTKPYYRYRVGPKLKDIVNELTPECTQLANVYHYEELGKSIEALDKKQSKYVTREEFDKAVGSLKEEVKTVNDSVGKMIFKYDPPDTPKKRTLFSKGEYDPVEEGRKKKLKLADQVALFPHKKSEDEEKKLN